MINKSEIKYIAYSSLFAGVYFLFLLPYLQKVIGDNPYMQFAVFNIGLYMFFFIFLKSLSLGTKPDLVLSLGFLMIFFALDIIMPEYHVSTDGLLIVGATLGASTADYITGLLGRGFGLNGIILFLFVYVVVPVLMLFVASKIFPNFVKKI